MEIENNILKSISDSDIINGVLKIPEGVTEIKIENNYFFNSGLTSLETIICPSSLKVINKRSFMSYSNLKSVKFSEGLEGIGEEAFLNCYRLKNISFPKSLKKVDNYAFSGCDGIEKLRFYENLKELGNSCFYNCTGLKSVDLSKTKLEIIPESCFDHCTLLKQVKLNQGLKEINERGFLSCGLKKLVLPMTIEKIGKEAFENCNKLVSVSQLKNLQELGRRAFMNCKSLKSIEIGGDLKKLYESTFRNCENLREVILSDSITSIERNTFSDCKSLEFIKLPPRLDNIGSETFKNCFSLESIKIPMGVYSIGSNAFFSCINLKSVELPNLLSIICNDAFFGCSELTDINIPKTVRSIGSSAFMRCTKLSKILLPESVDYIGDFCFDGCKNLENITIIGPVIAIGDGVFLDCENLTSVSLPSTIRSIGEQAFDHCKNLTKITLPDGVESINDSAFSWCRELSNFRFPKSLTSLGAQAFSNCVKLNNINLPQGLKSIGTEAFENCISLEKISIPLSVQNIGDYILSGCNQLQELIIPDKLESIGSLANNSFKYLSKGDNNFIFSNKIFNNSIELSTLKIKTPFLIKYYDYKNLILREQSNPNVCKFYNAFLSGLEKDKTEEFLNSHNFTFFKQLNIDELGYNYVDTYKGLYNLGAFLKPQEFDGKVVDYAQKVVGFLQEKLRKEVYTPNDLCDLFHGMKKDGFKKEFTDFFLKDFDELLRTEKIFEGFTSRCYNEFEKVQKTNTSDHGSQRQLKPTVAKFIDYFTENKFQNITPETKNIAITIAPYFSTQQVFDDAVSIDKERKENHISDNILSEPLNEEDIFGTIDEYKSEIERVAPSLISKLADIASKQFTFEWLAKNDPRNFILGKLCSCCAHLEGVGYGIMHASIVHPNIQNLVIKNEKGDIIAKSTLYINPEENYGVFNNVEVNRDIPYNDYELIYQKYMLAVAEFAEKYNSEHPDKPIEQINVGTGFNDLNGFIRQYNTRSNKILTPINYKNYGKPFKNYNGDSFEEQYVVWENKSKS